MLPWLILFSCFIGVFLQIEVDFYAVSSGRRALEAFDRLPVPGVRIGRGRLRWMNALGCVMAFCGALQLGRVPCQVQVGGEVARDLLWDS